MSILAAELKMYKPAVVNDTTSNGGRMSSNEIADAVKNALFPDVSSAERASGVTRYRKAYLKVANDADLTYQAPKLFIETVTPGDDQVDLFAATFEDTQAAITGSERKYGGGALNANVSAAATSIDVLVEDATAGWFADGDTIRISDSPTVDGAGNEEFMTIATSGVSYAGNVATLTLTAGLANGYIAASTRVASVYEPGDIAGAVTNWIETSTSGTYDEVTDPVAVDSIGGVSQQWTLTFSDPTNFTVSGDTLGSVGSGTTGGDFTPNNPDFGKPYFTLLAAGWAGTWASGETITFRTDPAAAPVWLRQVVPAAAAALSADQVIIAAIGDSA